RRGPRAAGDREAVEVGARLRDQRVRARHHRSRVARQSGLRGRYVRNEDEGWEGCRSGQVLRGVEARQRTVAAAPRHLVDESARSEEIARNRYESTEPPVRSMKIPSWRRLRNRAS